MPPHWTSDPRHFSSLTCDLQKLLSTFQKLEKLIIKWIRWEGRAGGAKVFTWMISPFTWKTARCNFPPSERWEFPSGWAKNTLVMHDRCDSTADENEADVSKPKHSSCVELFVPTCRLSSSKMKKKKKKKRCFERLMKITSFNVWEVIYSAEQRKHISSNQTPNTDANLINGHSVMLLTWPRRSRSCGDVPD